MAQLICGILPLRIETGRYACNYISENERLCLFCNCNEVENEVHFLFYCGHYNEIRESFYLEITYKCENFAQLNDKQKLNLLMSSQYVYDFSKFVRKCYLKRRETMYR